MNVLIPIAQQKLVAARRAYFEQGVEPEGLIDKAIYRSWTRCVAADKRERDSVEFEPAGRSLLSELMDRNNTLLRAASEPVGNLFKAVSGAGYAVLLTDSRGYALSVTGTLERRDRAMRLAFRQGVDLSENAIGTSAMACALAERRAVRVFGPEHFFSATRVFHCAAAPIIGPEGKVIGVVDITKDSPQPDLGALSLVHQCAQAIERELFRQLPSFLTLSLSWHASFGYGQQELILAFGADGEIIALNENARRFIGPHVWETGLHFESIFEGRFSQCANLLRNTSEAISIRLHSGLCLFASDKEFRVEPRRGHQARPDVPAGTLPAAPFPQLPEFGDPGIDRQIDTALRAQANGLPLLILGETGSGKEVVTNALHQRSRHGRGPFIAINCAAIPESLIEGELFGYADGAYTGARRGGAAGKIEMADGGTLFLDEIGDMPLPLQARLLRVLETREISRLGTTACRKLDFQLVCATHQDIRQAIRDGCFREDLYYRINGFALTLSPLRSRPGLPALVRTILHGLSNGRRQLSDAAMTLLQTHPWPGNVRELKHALTYAHAIADPCVLLESIHFPSTVMNDAEFSPTAVQQNQSGRLDSLEMQAIQHALRQAGDNIPQAARILGISRATLYRRLRKTSSG